MFFKHRQPVDEVEIQEGFDVWWKTLQELLQKQPEEVLGDPQEPVYYLWKVSDLLKAREATEARLLLGEAIKRFSEDVSVRLQSSTLYLELGDEAEAAAQLGVALSLQPSFFPAHSRLAYILLRRGEEAAAERLLEIGWSHMKKHVLRREQAEKRDQYFSTPKRRLAAEATRNAQGTSLC